MDALFKLTWAFFEICLLKRGPQDIPPAPTLLFLFFILYNLISIFAAVQVSTAQGLTTTQTVLIVVIESFAFVAVFGGMLYLAQLQERILQTLTALLGINVILELIALPFIIMVGQFDNPENIPFMLVFALTMLFTWHLLVYGHIVRHALDTTLGMGILFSFINIILIGIVLLPLLPRPEAVSS